LFYSHAPPKLTVELRALSDAPARSIRKEKENMEGKI